MASAGDQRIILVNTLFCKILVTRVQRKILQGGNFLDFL